MIKTRNKLLSVIEVVEKDWEREREERDTYEYPLSMALPRFLMGASKRAGEEGRVPSFPTKFSLCSLVP